MALPVFQATVQNDTGDILPGAQIDVIDESTGLAADIFSDRAGTLVEDNPFFADVDGFARFYAEPGEYRIEARAAGGGIARIWRFEVLPGNAALANTTDAIGDFTVGRVVRIDHVAASAQNLLANGSYGWGVSSDALALAFPAGKDLNSTDVPNGTYRVTSVNSTGAPLSHNDYIAIVTRWDEDDQHIELIGVGAFRGRSWARTYRSSVGDWSPWIENYTTGNILGTVSQSGGVPTGAIIERGSNANGEYVKFADGTLIQTFNLITSASAAVTKTFPVTFISTAYRVGYMVVAGSLTAYTVNISNALNASADFNGLLASDSSRQALTVATIAIGRWY